MKKRITFSLDKDLIRELKEISSKTMIPQARLVEKSIKDELKNYKK